MALTPPGPADDPLLRRAVKSSDSTFTTFLVTPYSKLIARWAARRSIAPTAVTVLSILLGLIAAGLFAVGQRPALIGGAIVLQMAFIADCVDGQLARYSGRTSAFGGWLDGIGDRGKEYAVYAGLALGSMREFGDPVWELAIAALAVQTFRHTIDFGYALRSSALARDAGPGSPPGLATDPGSRRSATHWLRRSLVLPIGERFALISVMAALVTPRATFIVLLCWAALATAYSLAGKVLRTSGLLAQ